MRPPGGPPVIWPDAETLYHSRLYAFFQAIGAAGPDRDRTHGVMLQILMRYAYGECLFLADAVARVAGQPTRLVRFTFPSPESEDHLLHAVLCPGAGPVSVRTSGLDVLGPTRIEDTAWGMRALGAITWEVVPEHDRPQPGEYPPEHAETTLRVAGCLPWLAVHVPARYRIGEACALACLTEIAEDPGFLAHREG